MFRLAAVTIILLGIAAAVLAIQVTRLSIQTARRMDQTERVMMERSGLTMEIPVLGGTVTIQVTAETPEQAVSQLLQYQRAIQSGLAQLEGGR